MGRFISSGQRFAALVTASVNLSVTPVRVMGPPTRFGKSG
jgi:hypothetical protein